MSGVFGILDSQYRLSETRFEPDLVVFKALDVNTDRLVAIKTPNDQMRSRADHVRRFADLGKRLAGLPEDAVVDAVFYAPGTFDDRCYLVHEWFDATLADYLAAVPRVPRDFARQTLLDILDGICVLHANGYVHGNLGPGSFALCGESRRSKLAEAGPPWNARNIEARQAYVAPEIGSAASAGSPAADIYAVGAMAYRLYLGAHEFRRVMRITAAQGEPGALDRLVDGIAPGLAHLASAMLRHAPGERPANAQAARAALREALHIPDRGAVAERHGAAGQATPAAPDTPPSVRDARAEYASLVPAREAVTGPVASAAAHEPGRSGRRLTFLVFMLVISAGALGYRYTQEFLAQRHAAGQWVAALEPARTRAVQARSAEHAAGAWALAEQRRGRAATAYAEAHYARAVALAGEAVELYAAARTAALEQRARVAGDRALAALRASDDARAAGSPDYAGALEALRRAKDAAGDHRPLVAERAFDDATTGFRRASAWALLSSLEGKWVALRERATAAGVASDAPDELAALEAYAASRRAREADDYDTAVAATRRAIAGVTALIDRTWRARVEDARVVADAARAAALAEGGVDRPDFHASDAGVARALSALREGSFAVAERELVAAATGFERTRAMARAETVRSAMLAEKTRALDAGVTLDGEVFTRAERHRKAAARAMTGADTTAAIAGFRSALREYRDARQAVLRHKLDDLLDSAGRARGAAIDARGPESTHFHLAESKLSSARGLLGEAARYEEARGLLEEARDGYGLALAEMRAVAARDRAGEAKAALGADPLPRFRTAILAADAAWEDGARQLAGGAYGRALALFDDATQGYGTVSSLARAGAVDARHDAVLERRERALGEAAGTTRLPVAERLWQAAVGARARGDFVAAATRLEEADSAYAEALAEGRALAGRDKARAAAASLPTADTAGPMVDAADDARSQARAALAAGRYEAAETAYKEASRLYMAASSGAFEKRARKAQAAAHAVRQSAASTPARDSVAFGEAVEAYQRAAALLAEQRYPQAYAGFQAAESAFDAAATRWAADEARRAMLAARDKAVGGDGQGARGASFLAAQQNVSDGESAYRDGGYSEAAQAFQQAMEAFQAAWRERVAGTLSGVRDAALAARDVARTASDLKRHHTAVETLAAAERAAEDSELSRARRLYARAASQFHEAVLESTALGLRQSAEAARVGALALGVAPRAQAFRAGMAALDKGNAALGGARFEAAARDYRQARREFDAASTAYEDSTRSFLAGSTPAEVATAVALCRTHVSGCKKGWFASESAREVRLRPFDIDDHEVSNEEFAQFARQQNYRTSAEKRGYSLRNAGQGAIRAPGYSWRAPSGRGSSQAMHPTRPVVHVSFNDAVAYCAWIGGRLPSADEWEYAARGKERRIFPWGNTWKDEMLRWGGDPEAGSMPVKSFADDATPRGIHDLAGNVREWTSTRTKNGAVLKGGSWVERNPANFRAAARMVADPGQGRSDIGFRCVWDRNAWPRR